MLGHKVEIGLRLLLNLGKIVQLRLIFLHSEQQLPKKHHGVVLVLCITVACLYCILIIVSFVQLPLKCQIKEAEEHFLKL